MMDAASAVAKVTDAVVPVKRFDARSKWKAAAKAALKSPWDLVKEKFTVKRIIGKKATPRGQYLQLMGNIGLIHDSVFKQKAEHQEARRMAVIRAKEEEKERLKILAAIKEEERVEIWSRTQPGHCQLEIPVPLPTKITPPASVEAEAQQDHEEEKRQDKDGAWYTHAEFVKYYGGDNEWEAATRAPIKLPNINKTSEAAVTAKKAVTAKEAVTTKEAVTAKAAVKIIKFRSLSEAVRRAPFDRPSTIRLFNGSFLENHLVIDRPVTICKAEGCYNYISYKPGKDKRSVPKSLVEISCRHPDGVTLLDVVIRTRLKELAGEALAKGTKTEPRPKIAVKIRTRCKLRRCNIVGGGVEINCKEGGHMVMLNECEIANAADEGVLIYGRFSRPVLQNNVITRSVGYGMWIQKGARPTVTENTVSDGRSSGVAIWHNSTFVNLKENKIVRNALNGVVLAKNTEPTIQRNQISDNGAYGVSVIWGASGSIHSNTFSNNARGPLEVHIHEDCDPAVGGNTGIFSAAQTRQQNLNSGKGNSTTGK